MVSLLLSYKIVSTAVVTLEVVNCPPGYKLGPAPADANQRACLCNFENNEILTCNQTKISFEVNTHTYIHTYRYTYTYMHTHVGVAFNTLCIAFFVVEISVGHS